MLFEQAILFFTHPAIISLAFLALSLNYLKFQMYLK